jgi:hypothetical protein
MKKFIQQTIVTTVVVIILPLQNRAQVCPDTITQVSTNFYNPINTQFDALFPPPIKNPFINRYDWAGHVPMLGFVNGLNLNPNAGWDPNLTGIFGGVWKMASPFSSAMGAEYGYLFRIGNSIPNTGDLQFLDWHPDRGWELMWMQTGYMPDGREINNPDPDSFLQGPFGLVNNKLAYVILYNRYTGKMRLFANLITEFGQVDNIVTYIKYDKVIKGQDVSGIFRNLANYDRPLDMPTMHWGATVHNKNPNNINSWYSNDIQLGYDPCVCEYPSYIDFRLKTMNSLKVNLYGRQLQTTVPVNAIEPDFLTQSAIQQNFNSGNSLIYKKTQAMYEDYMKQLDDYNTQLADYNALENTLKREVLKLGRDIVVSGTGSLFPTAAVKKMILGNSVTLKQFPDTNTADGWAKAAREASKSIMGKGFDYLTQGFVIDKPTAPTMPTATLSEMRITGNINDVSEVKITGLYTPGSYKTGTPSNPNSGLPLTIYDYPIYNKPVGLFALLERPKLLMYSESETQAYHINNHHPLPDRVTIRDHKLVFKFSEPLKYKFNDAVKIDKGKTNTFILFIVEYQHRYNINGKSGTLISKGTRRLNGNLNLMHHYNRTRIFETGWKSINHIHEQAFGIEFIDSMVSFPGDGTYFDIYNSVNNIKSIKMKIMTDMYFTDNPEMNTTQVFTYSIYDRDNPETETSVLQLRESLNEIKRYHLGELNINETHFAPGHPMVNTINGKELYVDAEDININGYISVEPGYTLHLRALNNIDVNPETVLNPEVILEIKKDYYNLPVFSEVTNDELTTYCNGQNKRYNANQSLAKHAPNSKEASDVMDKDAHFKQSLQVGLYPNPANSAFEVYTNAIGDYTITMIDITGRLVYTSEIAQNNKGIMDVSQLQNGIYFVQVTGNGHTTTQKLIVRH